MGETKTHIPCLQEQHLNGQFSSGVIVGPSGSGKTTSGERLFGKPKSIQWDSTRCIISHFGNNWQELFHAVQIPLQLGFSFYHFLSEGEKIISIRNQKREAPKSKSRIVCETEDCIDIIYACLLDDSFCFSNL